jgi:hypothetical protein
MSAYQACATITTCKNSSYLAYFQALRNSNIGDAVGAGVHIPFGAGLITPDQIAAYNAGQNATGSIGASCSSGGQSFTADTLVLTASGQTVPISALQVGDKVVAVNTATGKNQIETVDAVLVHHDTNLYDLTIETAHGKQVIHTTSNHLIWDTTTHTWVEAGKLHKGDHLLTADGTAATAVGGVTPATTQGWMWDLTVDTLHTFYVEAGDTPVLVHNDGGVIIGPNGEILPGIPDGEVGVPSATGKGTIYQIPEGTTGVDSRVTQMRVMDPTGRYPDGYVVYMNKGGQTVNPVTGRTTVGKADPYGHVELPPAC